MAWRIDLDDGARTDLAKLDKPVAKRIAAFFRRLSNLDDPRSLGDALKGIRYDGLWKYRVGDYRIIARIEDRVVRILVVRIGNRKEVYKGG